MPKFLRKHGCCSLPPGENESSTTCQVFHNPDFDSRVSDALCIGKSSPEFPHNRKQISWGYIDDIVVPHCSVVPPENIDRNKEIQLSESEEENLSVYTIYGHKIKVSDVSIYRPTTTTKSITTQQASSSEKFLDCLSNCFWKCSSWCQKVE